MLGFDPWDEPFVFRQAPAPINWYRVGNAYLDVMNRLVADACGMP